MDCIRGQPEICGLCVEQETGKPPQADKGADPVDSLVVPAGYAAGILSCPSLPNKTKWVLWTSPEVAFRASAL